MLCRCRAIQPAPGLCLSASFATLPLPFVAPLSSCLGADSLSFPAPFPSYRHHALAGRFGAWQCLCAAPALPVRVVSMQFRGRAAARLCQCWAYRPSPPLISALPPPVSAQPPPFSARPCRCARFRAQPRVSFLCQSMAIPCHCLALPSVLSKSVASRFLRCLVGASLPLCINASAQRTPNGRAPCRCCATGRCRGLAGSSTIPQQPAKARGRDT